MALNRKTSAHWRGDDQTTVWKQDPDHCGKNHLTIDSLILGCLFCNIAKGATDPRVEFISQVQTQILIKFHLQNLDQATNSKFGPNISILTKLKIQNLVQNLDQDSTS